MYNDSNTNHVKSIHSGVKIFFAVTWVDASLCITGLGRTSLLSLGGRFRGEVVRGIWANGAFKTVRSDIWEAQLLYFGHTTR